MSNRFPIFNDKSAALGQIPCNVIYNMWLAGTIAASDCETRFNDAARLDFSYVYYTFVTSGRGNIFIS